MLSNSCNGSESAGVVVETCLGDDVAAAVLYGGLRNSIGYVVSEGSVIGDVCFPVGNCWECGRATGVEFPSLDAGHVHGIGVVIVGFCLAGDIVSARGWKRRCSGENSYL